MQFEFTKDEFNDLIYAAREAHIRFKRARTELRAGNERYQNFDEDLLNEDISRYANIEEMLKKRYLDAFGEWW